MVGAFAEFVSTRQGDSLEFIAKARALAIGVALDSQPARLYVIRIDNWFGPKRMHFAGKFTVGKGYAIGVHKPRLHVPPFVPGRVVEQRVFAGPSFEETVAAAPLHIDCPSEQALLRRIADIDAEAAFLWFSGESEAQKRGSLMVYLPDVFDAAAQRGASQRDRDSLYIGFSQRYGDWEPSMLRGISRTEVAHLEESRRALIDSTQFTTAGE